MPSLNLTFFDSPRISINGTTVNHRIDKGIALLALLALQGPRMHRDTLSALLWTGSDASKARAALRTAIWRLKDVGLSPWLDSDREFITLNKNDDIWIDVDEFRVNLEKSKQPPHDLTTSCPICSILLERAIDLYHGDFMAGYSPRNAAGYDDWCLRFGQLLRNDYLSALERLVKGYFKRGQYANAVQISRQWLKIDPYNEESHNLIIRSYAYSNQPSTAIAHFRAYKRQLRTQLDISPGKEITTLYRNILSGKNPPLRPITHLPEPVLLLLDIDQAAHLRARYGALMEHEVVRFTNLVNESLLHYGGRLIKHSGDSFTIYFDHGEPLMYAIAFHRQVAQTRWDLPAPLSIRIVITTLPNNQCNQPEYSTELQGCWQLLQSSSGDQVLLTEPALRTLELPNTSRTHNLGSFFISGLTYPTKVYQLVHPQLPAPEPKPLQSLVRSPTNLPVQSTRFVGREAELNQITHLLSQPACRLITLAGPGGVGKTRLGIQVISQLHPTPPDGIYYVPLVAHQDPATIYQPIADALNLSFNNPSDQAAQLIEHLSTKHMLLLLDNFEHLLSAKSFLLMLLEGAPGLQIMLTSREHLNLTAEVLIEVHGLSFPHDPHDPDFELYSGIKLFIQNAQRVSPGFVLSAEDKPHIIQICAQVGGLPLGIELSSAWVRAFSCQEIAGSIQQNPDFVQSSSPDIPTRHRSLRAAFDHSWRLLSEEDRRTITKLSIYRNGFFTHASERLANANPTMLASYVDKNILTRQSNGRYLMPETLRTYALEILKADPLDYVNRLNAHSEYYINHLIALFNAFAGENGASAIKEFWLDVGNIHDALNWAIEQHDWSLLEASLNPLLSFYELQGRIREGYDITIAIMKRVAELIGTQQPDIYYSLLGWDGAFSFRLGYSQDALEKMKSRLAYAQSQNDILHAANTLMLLADSHRRHGDLITALEEINQCMEIFTPLSTSDNALLLGFYANALTVQGMIQVKLGQLEAAHQAVNLCNAVLERSRTRYVRIRLLDLQARIAVVEHSYKESLDLRLEAVSIAEEFNDRRNTAILMNNLSDAVISMGDVQSSIAYMNKANQISNEIGDRQLIALTSNNLGFLTLLHQNPSDAIPIYERSLAMYRTIHNILGTFFTLRDTSRAYLMARDPISARHLIVEALHLGKELDQPSLVLQLLTVIAHLTVQTGQPERAVRLCSLAVAQLNTNTFMYEEAKKLLAEIAPQAPDDPTLPSSPAPELPTFASLLAEI